MSDILLIPGNMCDERLWGPVAKRLIAAGHGVQYAPPLVHGLIAVMAEQILSTLHAPVIAVGFSMGAIIAAEMARSAPDSITALGLVAFNASADLPERAAVRPRQQEEVRTGALARIVADELKPNYLARASRGDAELLDTVMKMALSLGPDVFVAQSEALRLREDLRSGLCRLTMPVMLSCGSEDRLCPPEWHRAWADMIGANASFDEVQNAGHLLPLEQPGALADALIDWLEKEALCQTVS